MVMEGLLRPLARPSVLLVLVGLAITGYGMGVFFHGLGSSSHRRLVITL
jgi:hypothetical protein